MEDFNILAIISLIISIGGVIISIINHKKVVSSCFGSKKFVVASLDIDNTTPQNLNITK
jgi:hypothetical protein